MIDCETVIANNEIVISKLRSRFGNLPPKEVEDCVKEKQDKIVDGIRDGKLTFENESQLQSYWIKGAVWCCKTKHRQGGRFENNQVLNHTSTRTDDPSEIAIQNEEREDKYSFIKRSVEELLYVSFGLPEEIRKDAVEKAFKKEIAELKFDASNAEGEAERASAARERVVFDMLDQQGSTIADALKCNLPSGPAVGTSAPTVSIMKRRFIGRLLVRAIREIEEFRVVMVEVSESTDKNSRIPDARPGMTLIHNCISRASTGFDESPIKFHGRLNILLLRPRKSLPKKLSEFIDELKVDALFTCENTTLLAEVIHPQISSNQPHGVNMQWIRQDETQIGVYFNDGRANGFWLVCKQKVGRPLWMKKLEMGETIQFDQGASFIVPAKREVKNVKVAPMQIPLAKEITITSPTGIEDFQFPKNAEVVGMSILDNLGAIVATTDIDELNDSEMLPMRRKWGWPIHIKAEPDTPADGTTIIFEYVGNAATTDRTRRGSESIDLDIKLELREVKNSGSRS